MLIPEPLLEIVEEEDENYTGSLLGGPSMLSQSSPKDQGGQSQQQRSNNPHHSYNGNNGNRGEKLLVTQQDDIDRQILEVEEVYEQDMANFLSESKRSSTTGGKLGVA